RHTSQLLAQLLAFCLQTLDRNAGTPVEFIVKLAPSPRRRRIPRWLAPTMRPGPISNRARPRGCRALQLRKQCAPQIQVGLLALKVQQALISLAVLTRILINYG